MTATDFPDIRFNGSLRPSQQDVVDIARHELAAGRRRLHVVAPPGSGKTVMGLYLWAEVIRRPALVLSPNSAIQSQWQARTDLFQFAANRDAVVSTDPRQPALLTSLTYQSVTLPGRGTDFDERALDLWIDQLVANDEARDPDEARIWIDDLRRHNADYYERRLGRYRKAVRDQRAIDGNSLEVLHDSVIATLKRLRGADVGMIILDECHHLMGHWGRVLSDAHEFLESPIVVGLTATPPDRSGKHKKDLDRYDQFFGPIDFEVPVPAVVKDGFLAPYQDLAWLVRPTSAELEFIAEVEDRFERLVEDLCRPAEPANDTDAAISPTHESASGRSNGDVESTDLSESADDDMPEPDTLPDWLLYTLSEYRSPTGRLSDWTAFERRDPAFADAARRFLRQRQVDLPDNVPPVVEIGSDDSEPLAMETLIPVLDRYVRHHLRRSPDPGKRTLGEQLVERLRFLGVQITDVGARPCASPVGRVLAYGSSKVDALIPILTAERKQLGDRIRAVVITDFEKTSAVTSDVSHLLDAEAGGAVAAFRKLISDPETDALNPVLLTGSTVLVDDDVAAAFDAAAQQWVADNGVDIELRFGEDDGFHVVAGSGADWCPRVYVRMVTDLFLAGVTQCLVGTRGLLGEGWDANRINVLMDLTTATTSMTVNQLRGRSIRLDPNDPAKVANNWDVVCLAPEFAKGLDDYHRFIRKHKTVFGITDDGAIEKGCGHVHAAFTELKPEGLEGSVSWINADMLRRAATRDHVRQQWEIGQPYNSEPVHAVESKLMGDDGGGFPPFEGRHSEWSAGSLGLAIGEAVLASLHDTNQISGAWPVHLSERNGGYVRVFLEEASDEDSSVFAKAFGEAVGPLGNPRYVIPREVDHVSKTLLSRLLPDIIGRYFVRRERSMAMLHAVPSLLARNRKLVDVYTMHWNRLVSPGDAVYARGNQGAELVEDARRQRLVPANPVHSKEIFL